MNSKANLSLSIRTVFAPNIGGFIEMGNKYISPEMGFAMGINYILLTGFTVPTEITAIGLMIGFWDESSSHVRPIPQPSSPSTNTASWEHKRRVSPS